MLDANDKNDNLRMGSRIKRGELVNMWMFGRLTAGTTQGKKENKFNMQVYTFKNEITGRCLADSLKGRMQKNKTKNQFKMHASTLKNTKTPLTWVVQAHLHRVH